MKQVIYAIGGLAIALLTIGIFLYILMQWGALVEYHAFEWRGVQPTMKSPLTKATANLSYCFLGTSLLAGLFAFILLFTTTPKKARKTHNKHLEQNKTPSAEDQNQINS